MFRFENTYMLYVLLLIPILIGVFHWIRIQRSKALARFGESELVEQLMPEFSKTKPIWKFYLFLAAVVFVILGLARPQFGSKLQEVKRKGIE
ncbi:MAG TPA: BatA domain-containing protein, partial [Bacteroidales bacterium]